MRAYRRLIAKSLFALALMFGVGCNKPINPNQGFYVTTNEALASTTGMPGPPVVLPHAHVTGNFLAG